MYKLRKDSLKSQYSKSILLILLTSCFYYVTIGYMDYRAVALMFLLVVSILVMLFDRFKKVKYTGGNLRKIFI